MAAVAASSSSQNRESVRAVTVRLLSAVMLRQHVQATKPERSFTLQSHSYTVQLKHFEECFVAQAVRPIASEYLSGLFVVGFETAEAALTARSMLSTDAAIRITVEFSSAFNGFLMKCLANACDEQLASLANSPGLLGIVRDELINLNTSTMTAAPPTVVSASSNSIAKSWGLDRVDQPFLPMDGA